MRRCEWRRLKHQRRGPRFHQRPQLVQRRPQGRLARSARGQLLPKHPQLMLQARHLLRIGLPQPLHLGFSKGCAAGCGGCLAPRGRSGARSRWRMRRRWLLR